MSSSESQDFDLSHISWILTWSRQRKKYNQLQIFELLFSHRNSTLPENYRSSKGEFEFLLPDNGAKLLSLGFYPLVVEG